ncbi:MAG TPA: transglycosylase domain-containing protein [Micropepsaceae bacterium]|nr:transglycosylase domain-containing protein [Micropepsaceae bacterium]
MLWSFGLSCVALGIGAAVEAQTGLFESQYFARSAARLTFTVASGASGDIRFPKGGPEDKRLGYSALPGHIASLKAHDFVVTQQASWSEELDKFTADHGYAVYREKEHAGLTLKDRAGASFYRATYPERVYADFGAIPALVVSTLLFIEDRSLLDPSYPHRNPAVNWKRFALASAGQAAGWLDPSLRQGGASTLATQIEKFRHYPDGRTRTIEEKLRQMMAASTRSYLDGPDTIPVQQRIISTYLDSTPLSSRPVYGEIIGIGDGLWAWYGTDLTEANRVLSNAAMSARKAEIYKQVLSLLLAQRRPSYYLVEDRSALDALANSYLRSLAQAGVIGSDLRDAALRAELKFLPQPPSSAPVSFVERKAAASIRTELLGLMGTPSLYDLDRLDLTAETALDAGSEQRVSEVLEHLGSRDEVNALGLVGKYLLGNEDPSRVSYSVVLYERAADRNFVRVRADSLDQPFDINSGAKLILGSTAKLRTLITYLDIVTELHGKYGDKPDNELLPELAKAEDPLTRWAISYLVQSDDHGLQPMLDEALERRYSANPAESFFTGGGVHVFENFERYEDRQVPTVEEALTNSVNLAFIRVMRDIRSYYTVKLAREKSQAAVPLSDQRLDSLRRFADEEGRTYLNRFYADLRGRKPDEMLHLLSARAKGKASRLAILFRSLKPNATEADFRKFLGTEAPKIALKEGETEKLFANADPERYSLVDRAFIARVHPLELWLAAYLQEHPAASRAEVAKESQDERQEAYTWLFKTRSAKKQDKRIRIVSEEEAFGEILKDWRRQGYPFDSMVPSLASVLGSSGDRPDALAHLMGIILSDGMEYPTAEIERLQFAAGTPYETGMALKPGAPKRILAPEVARTVRRVLMTVVADGTATRLRGTYVTHDGEQLIVGGKTGTGDNRIKSFGAGQKLIESRAVDRTATFVFFIGDRFYGTVTAYVAGAEAANYHFTSALAVQLLKALSPQLQSLIDTPKPPEFAASPADTPAITLVSGPDEHRLMTLTPHEP